ncbi:22817_t:CDS:2, partial [Entrophospora sp. SA101]
DKKKLEFLELRILHYKYREFDVNNELKSIEERLHKIEEEKKVAEEELASLTNTTTS